jgi:type IV secretion system protein VirB6
METPFAKLERMLADPVVTASEKVIDLLTGAIGPVLTAAMTVYVMFLGIRIMQGESQLPMSDFVKLCVKCCVISMLCMQSGNYTSYVSGVFIDMADKLARLVGNAPSGDVFDTILMRIFAVAAELWQGVSAWSPAKSFMIMVLYAVLSFFGICLIVSMFAVYLYAKVMMLYVLCLGPVFLALGLFDQTRQYRDGFLGQVLTLVVQQVLAVLLLAIFIKAFDAEFSSFRVDQTRVTQQVFGMCALMVFCNALTVLIPNIASRLGGHGIGFGHRSLVQGGQAAGAVVQSVTAAGSAVGNYVGSRVTGSRADSMAAAASARGEQQRYEQQAGTFLSEGRVAEASGAQAAGRMWAQQAAGHEQAVSQTGLRATAAAVGNAGFAVGEFVGSTDMRAAQPFNPANPSADTSLQVASLQQMARSMAPQESSRVEPIRAAAAVNERYAAAGAAVVSGVAAGMASAAGRTETVVVSQPSTAFVADPYAPSEAAPSAGAGIVPAGFVVSADEVWTPGDAPTRDDDFSASRSETVRASTVSGVSDGSAPPRDDDDFSRPAPTPTVIASAPAVGTPAVSRSVASDVSERDPDGGRRS